MYQKTKSLGFAESKYFPGQWKNVWQIRLSKGEDDFDYHVEYFFTYMEMTLSQLSAQQKYIYGHFSPDPAVLVWEVHMLLIIALLHTLHQVYKSQHLKNILVNVVNSFVFSYKGILHL